jgi:hypothetical protein
MKQGPEIVYGNRSFKIYNFCLLVGGGWGGSVNCKAAVGSDVYIKLPVL